MATVEPVKGQNTGAVVGAAGAAAIAGGLGGYYLGGSRPNLEEVFQMKPDTFTAATKNAEGEAKTAVDQIAGARNELDAVAKEQTTKVNEAAKPMYKGIQSQSSEEITQLKDKADKAVEALKNKIVKSGDVELKYDGVNQAVKDAETLLRDAKTDADKKAANEALTKASASKKEFLNGASSEITAVKDSQSALYKAKKAAFDKAAGTEGNAKTLKDAYDKAIADGKKAVSDKLEALKNDEKLSEAYGKIKKMFDFKGNKKAAWITAICAAAVAAVGAYVLGNNDKKAA